MIDIHCHLFKKDYGNPQGILDECEKKGIMIVLNGLDYETNKELLELSKKSKNAFLAMGMHPSYKFEKKAQRQIIEFKDEIIAIGEIGLDFKEGHSEKQIINFKKMIKLAEELNKPIIIHSRGAEKEAIECIESIKVPAIFHCYTGKKKLIKEALKNPKAYFSIPSSIKYSEQFRDLAKEVPIERLLCETDSPYLWKSEKNTPLNVVHAYEEIAKIKGITFEEACEKISNNAFNAFKITEFKNNRIM